LDYALHSKVEHLVRDISPLVGGIIGFALLHDAVGYAIYMTILIGAITYIMVRDFLPRSDKGKPLYFVIGVVIMVVFFFIFSSIPGEH
jgi:zinc transporter ZupT